MGELTARYCFSFCLVLHGYFSVFNKLTSVEDCLFSNLAMTPAHTHTHASTTLDCFPPQDSFYSEGRSYTKGKWFSHCQPLSAQLMAVIFLQSLLGFLLI